MTTFTVLTKTANGPWAVSKRGQISKATQWHRLFDSGASAQAAAPASPQPSTDVIADEACSHGSPIVLNDGVDFTGSYLCFTTVPGASHEFDLGTADGSFVVRSAYAVAPVVMFDGADVAQIAWCNTDNVQQEGNYQGPAIRYLQAGDDLAGPCQASSGE